jgi:short-subunit dehydrogenase
VGVTVVTGASSGIGASLARRIAARGDAVALLARREDRLRELAAEIEAAGGRALAIACDVTDRASVAAAIARVEQQLGPITRLIANAGGGEPTSVDPFDAAHVQATLDLNVVGVANCIAAVLPGMLSRRSGHLVAMGSLAAMRGLPGAAAYSAAKAAVANMMESLRIDLQGSGVDVTLLAPGFVNTKPGKKKKKRRRPFTMPLEDATERMARAIERRERVYAFPASLVMLLKLSRLVPRGVLERLLAGRGPSPRDRKDRGA